TVDSTNNTTVLSCFPLLVFIYLPYILIFFLSSKLNLRKEATVLHSKRDLKMTCQIRFTVKNLVLFILSLLIRLYSEHPLELPFSLTPFSVKIRPRPLGKK
ncbi:hypothetical protein ACROYT_G019779, partial [Oculina patagonica]